MTGCFMMNAKAREASLTDVDLRKANLTQADFTQSVFDGANMSGIMDFYTFFDDASFNGTIR